MSNKIEKKIVAWSIKKSDILEEDKLLTKSEWEELYPQNNELVGMHEKVRRHTQLSGITYKVSPSTCDESFYVTVNHQLIDGRLYPFEVFINSKSVEHYSWIAALTRMISSVWRKGGNTDFIVEELASIHDHQGYWGKNDKDTGKKKYYTSIISEIGDVIDSHLQYIYKLNCDNKPNNEEDVEEIEAIEAINIMPDTPISSESYPPNAVICKKCHERAVVRLDNCATCLSCSDSACG